MMILQDLLMKILQDLLQQNDALFPNMYAHAGSIAPQTCRVTNEPLLEKVIPESVRIIAPQAVVGTLVNAL